MGFRARRGDVSHGDGLGSRLEASLSRVQTLRYGENPHQPGAFYVPTTGADEALAESPVVDRVPGASAEVPQEATEGAKPAPASVTDEEPEVEEPQRERVEPSPWVKRPRPPERPRRAPGRAEVKSRIERSASAIRAWRSFCSSRTMTSPAATVLPSSAST